MPKNCSNEQPKWLDLPVGFLAGLQAWLRVTQQGFKPLREAQKYVQNGRLRSGTVLPLWGLRQLARQEGRDNLGQPV